MSTPIPSFEKLVDRRQRLAFGLGQLMDVLERVTPALRCAEVVDEDRAQTAFTDDVRAHPHSRVETVEDGQYPPSRPALICEQEANLVGLYRASITSLDDLVGSTCC